MGCGGEYMLAAYRLKGKHLPILLARPMLLYTKGVVYEGKSGAIEQAQGQHEFLSH